MGVNQVIFRTPQCLYRDARMDNNASIVDKIWKSMRARIRAEKRLRSNDFHGRLILLWYSFFSVATSIYYLKFNTSSGYISVSWVVFSVLILVIATFLSSVNFKGKAELMRQCHLALSLLYNNGKANCDDETKKIEKYAEILNISENHTTTDYIAAMWSAKLSGEEITEVITSYSKAQVIIFWILRFITLVVLYSCPAIIFLILEYGIK